MLSDWRIVAELGQGGTAVVSAVENRWSGAARVLKLARGRETSGAIVAEVRALRTRPIFKEWSGAFDLVYDDSLVNERELREMIVTCGQTVGLLEWHPRFGRFEVV